MFDNIFMLFVSVLLICAKLTNSQTIEIINQTPQTIQANQTSKLSSQTSSTTILKNTPSQRVPNNNKFLPLNEKNPQISTYRKSVLKKNQDRIKQTNAKNLGYKLQINQQFGYLTSQQFISTFITVIPSTPSSILYARAISGQFQNNPKSKDKQDKTPKNTKKIKIKDLEQEIFAKHRKYFNNKNIKDLKVQNSLIQKHRYKKALPQIDQDLIRDGLQQLQAIFSSSSLATNTSNTTDITSRMALTNSTTSNMTTITTTTIIASNTTSNTTTSTNTTNTTTTTIMSAGLSTNDNIDWSCTVGSIRQQGLCGSCYAFAVTDTISSLFYIYNAYNWTSYLALAVQDMIDCSYSSLSYGCLGAEVPGSYQFAVIGGLTTNDKYPYQYIAGYGNESFTKSCDNALGIEPRYFINRSFAILDPTCKNILSYLKRNPLTVEIKLNKTDLNFQFYRSGQYDCGITDKENQVSHAIVLVGYEFKRGWKLKNSWGTTWGQNGYFWLKDGNTCRMCQRGYFGTPDDNVGSNNHKRFNVKVRCSSKN